ncbi:MAG TPA: hypothetical protein EYP14_02310 [Planctomycetaceae bacterium]|nr:hypothetical protein [Planctomycetaceae bacterium]
MAEAVESAREFWQDTILIVMSDNGDSAEDYRIEFDGHASGDPRGHRYRANGVAAIRAVGSGPKAAFWKGASECRHG